MPTKIAIAGETFDLYLRHEWGAKAIDLVKVVGDNGPPEPRGYLHHEGGGLRNHLTTVAAEMQQMRNLEHFCINTKGYTTIDYGYCVMPTGRAYEARGFAIRPAATLNENNESEAVCLIGNHDQEPALGPALNTAALLFAWGAKSGHLVAQPDIRGHRESVDHPGATTCPGGKVNMDAFRNLVRAKIDWKPPTTEVSMHRYVKKRNDPKVYELVVAGHHVTGEEMERRNEWHLIQEVEDAFVDGLPKVP